MSSKCAKTLSKLGVNIKDQHNKIKQLSEILEEVAQKWDNLTEEMQSILAQDIGDII